jgi:thioredoxin reductase
MNSAISTPQASYDAIVVGGSYAGLAAAMALGRSLRRVLVIDGGKPCNAQTPHSHNFLTRDGETPAAIAALGRSQVQAYDTVHFLDGLATDATRAEGGFVVGTDAGQHFFGRKLIFATGIRDLLPNVPGLAECWGISVLHCPYCHGYEVRGLATGLLAKGDSAFEFAALLSNWTKDLTVLTNGGSTFTEAQIERLAQHQVRIETREIERLEAEDGRLQAVRFRDGAVLPLRVIYTRPPFLQHSPLPAALGCELTDQGYFRVDGAQRTTVPGIFACGDNASSMRTVANAVGTGTTAGMMANRELVMEDF